MLWLPELAVGVLLLALTASLTASGATILALSGRYQWPLLKLTGWSCTVFALVGLSTSLLLIAFVTDDFSLMYVAQHGHQQLPLLLKVAALWGGHEGSLLLWLLCLTGWSALYALRSRKSDPRLSAATSMLMALMIAAFLIFILKYSDPFVRLFPPAREGRDLNPMLQHIGLILHPPLLYLGYSGFATGCALSLGGLLTRQFNAELAAQCWRWICPAWVFLTAGIILGSWWAYSELGWGGWWFWDPVENAALLPWLASTALLHSLIITKNSARFRHWSLLLVQFTFILSLLGTLVVRSGILVSVHAFALDEVRTIPLLFLFMFLSVATLLIYALRGHSVTDSPSAGLLKKEWNLFAALLIFSAAIVIVLLGTYYPMIYRLLARSQISVGAPYFNTVLLPFGLLGLVLMCFGGGSLKRLPMLLAHSGVFIAALGIGYSSYDKQEISLNVAVGESVELNGYRFTFERINLLAKDNYSTEQAVIALTQGEQLITHMYPERRYYTVRRQQMFEPGIAWSLFKDWYVVMGEKSGEDRYAMRFYIQTGIRWIWGGGILMICGVILSGWQRRQTWVH